MTRFCSDLNYMPSISACLNLGFCLQSLTHVEQDFTQRKERPFRFHLHTNMHSTSLDPSFLTSGQSLCLAAPGEQTRLCPCITSSSSIWEAG